MYRLAFQPDLAFVGNDGAANRLDQRRFAGAVVADHGQDFARIEVEIRIVEGGDAAIALDQAAGGEKGFLCHQPAYLSDPLVDRDGGDDEDADQQVGPLRIGADHAQAQARRRRR